MIKLPFKQHLSLSSFGLPTILQSTVCKRHWDENIQRVSRWLREKLLLQFVSTADE